MRNLVKKAWNFFRSKCPGVNLKANNGTFVIENGVITIVDSKVVRLEFSIGGGGCGSDATVVENGSGNDPK